MTPEKEALRLLRGLRRQMEREVRAEWTGRVRALMAENKDLRARAGRFVAETEKRNAAAEAERERRADKAVPDAYQQGRQNGRAEAYAEALQRLEVKPGDMLVLKTAHPCHETADALSRGLAQMCPDAVGKTMILQVDPSVLDVQVLPDAATIARMTDALRRARAHLAHPVPQGAWSLARLIDSILVDLPPLVVSVPETQVPPEQVQAIRKQFDALKGKGTFHDVLVLDQPAIEQQAAEFLERLDASLAADALDPAATSNAEVAAELRAAGADPERIGREGESLVWELAAKLPPDDPRRALVLGPEQLAEPVTPPSFTGAEPDVLVVEGSCRHEHVAPEAWDQTIAVFCLDCEAHIAECWAGRHIPESLWNRACQNDVDGIGAKPCVENRDDVCALCKKPIPQEAAQVGEPGFLGIPVGSTIEVDLDAAARSGAFEAAIDQERPEPVVVRDDEVPPEE